jgi:hypothetical protein
MIPRSESELSTRVDSNRGVDSAFIHSVVERWRGRRWATSASSAKPPPSPASRQGNGAFVTEAEQPLLAPATRSINAQSTVRASLLRK